MENDIPLFLVEFDADDLTQGVYGVSLVDDPAIGADFIALKADTPTEIKLQNKEKQTVVGPVLIPNQKIYRNNNGKEYNIVFTAETIEKLSQEFLKRGFYKTSFYNHDTEQPINLSVVESWITGVNDKSRDLGYILPEGTWMISMKLEDEDWKEYVKSGKVKGFSIDSFLDMREINMTKLQKLHSQYVKMLQDMNSITVEGTEMFFEGALEESNILTDSEGKPIQASFEFEGFQYTTDLSGKIIEINNLEELNKQKQQMEEVEPQVQSEVIDHIMEIVSIMEEAGMPVEAMKEKLGMAPKEEEVAMEEEVKEEEVAMEEKEDEEKVLMKSELALLRAELANLKKAPAAQKLSQVVVEPAKGKESAMSVIQRLANRK
jgi:hypothetical protein